MIYERLKTATLIILVLLSVFLTWKLWTFQPEYALLEGTEYVTTSPLSEERKLKQLIVPEQIVIHHEEDSFFLANHHFLFKEIYQKIIDAKYEINLEEMATENAPIRKKAIEVNFRGSIPTEIIASMFEIPIESIVSPKLIDSVILFEDELRQALRLQLVSYSEKRSIELSTSVSHEVFSSYLYSELPLAFSYPYKGDENNWRAIYLPTEPLVFQSISYTSTLLPATYFEQLLFSEPTSVKYYRQENGEESFTDGNRMMNVFDHGSFMEYINPIYSDKVERGSKHIINSSLDFINGHGGWTDNYTLDSWSNTSLKEEVKYRLTIQGLPVIHVQGIDQMNINVARTGTQISRYSRPLFDIDRVPIDTIERVLPSGEDVIMRLAASEWFDMGQLEKVVVGFEMQKWNSIVTVEPHWFVFYRDVWQKVPMEDAMKREGGSDGLE